MISCDLIKQAGRSVNHWGWAIALLSSISYLAVAPAVAQPLPPVQLNQFPSTPPSTPPPDRSQAGGSLATPATPTAVPPGIPPTPPSTPPPNRTRSGGSLGGSESCQAVNQPIIALIPVENPVLTIAAHPTVLVYVPYAADAIQVGEFSVLVGLNETTRLYQTRFTLPATPGIVSLRLPETAEFVLATDTPYHWYFKLYCADTTAPADFSVDGWIQRVTATPEREAQIQAATPDIWYDALAQVSDRLRTSPQNPELQAQWRNLLTEIGLADLEEVPLVGSVQAIATEEE